MSVLPMVVKHTQALLTPLESICFDGVKHTSWLTITCPHSAHGTACIFGNACASLAESKQSVAKKAITFMMHTYNFSIIDANYQAADYASILCALERESYLTTQERVLNIQEPIHPSPLVVDQDCLTPRGKQFQIPTMYHSFPPKKRKARSSFGSVATYLISVACMFKGLSDPSEQVFSGESVGAAISVGQEMPTAALTLPPVECCSKCSAIRFFFEPLGFCCSDGEVEIASNSFPSELIRLFTSQDDDAVHFRTYSRLYNNLFAFSSLGGDFDSCTQKGIYVFKLHGQIYHFIPNLLPTNDNPKFLQLYFYDAQHESENRLNLFPELRADVIAILMEIMQHNPYAKFFKSLRELDVVEDTEIRLNKDPVLDQRVYNAPTAEEVAVIWAEDSATSVTGGPHIIVHGKAEREHRIMHYYGCYDPLQYPLLRPYGDCGWHHGLKKTGSGGRRQRALAQQNFAAALATDVDTFLAGEASVAAQVKTSRTQISCRAYYAYLLQMRPRNYILRACRLFQQFIVDMYVKLENTRLDFFRHNQAKIRAELYQGILDCFEGGENSGANMGHRVILPPTFLGGPRDMKRRYLNALTLVQRYGKPDLFITMTCNPNWPEIKACLAPGELAQHRPDIVARVFRAKLLKLKKMLFEDSVLGEVAAYTYVVEFQKRGLPHAHLLLIMKPSYKIKEPDAFDKFISAEIPDESNSHLRRIVLSHMMHGPCGKANTECPCMKHKSCPGTCKYGYPKAFREETSTHENGFPLYRRRNSGQNPIIRKFAMDNRWVIPYNPYLSALFDCHLNVEVCSTIQAVKYIYKYVYKGHDKISFAVSNQKESKPVDEITQFQTGRWVSPCEAAWRIFSFDLFEMYPPVLPLQVHLPNAQTVQFNPTEQLARIVASDARSRTSLTEFFKVNAAESGAAQLLYSEFPEHYVWTASAKTWTKRVHKRFVVGRLIFVVPAEGERYFLRLLLANVVRLTIKH
ncbi:uncharacterized protein LOC104900381 [Beta vulgaris subsp. vulgaris]|uniref:uncharacterized protein LOC104900381 n=1 Tax=Beta vulgaris subsp. vulgaris TaxID=3555 RepID=UPI0025482AD0|nr:uncharacterized protein LOC104900381 [Beta vulgaris subsp. vulgaris]